MTGRADDDKCRGGKAITGSVRCSRERSGHSLPADCRVQDAHAHIVARASTRTYISTGLDASTTTVTVRVTCDKLFLYFVLYFHSCEAIEPMDLSLLI